MWLDKLGLKAAALALVGAVSSMAAGIDPLYYTDASGSRLSSTASTNNWNYLVNYKMWGQTAISFGGNCKFEKPDGWVGAAGGLSSTGNDTKIAGTILVGGKADNTGKMEFSTGPVRTGGGITDGGRASGTVCQGTTTAGSCANVPLYRTDMTVPKLDWPGTNHSDISVSDHGSITVDLTDGPYDLYINSFSVGQDATVIFRMAKGRVIRVFTKSFTTTTHPNIVVQYDGENFYRCNSRTSTFTCGGDYEGNLLIYVDNNVTFQNVDYHPIVGTIVSTGTIKIICNMGFAGQLMAKTLTIGNEVKGDGFQFVPFKEIPKIILSQKTATFKEDDKWHDIGIGLNIEGEENVTFEYCFEFYGTDIPGQYATVDDVDASGKTHPFPICGTSKKSVMIPSGQLEAGDADKIYIKPLIDSWVEESTAGEKMWLKITNIKGAEVSSDNYDATHSGFNIFIQDSDEYPRVSSQLVVNVNEDDKHAFTKDEFKFVHSTRTFAAVIIVSLPDRGSLLLNGKAVSKNQKIAVADLTKLTYAPVANDFGNKYTSFKYKVVGSGDGDNTSKDEYTATVNVIPVNDKPTTEAKYTFSVPEEPEKNQQLGVVTYDDVPNEINKDSYTFSVVSGDADFSTYFELTKDGKVKVKGQPTFDYYTKSSYTIKAKVTDNAATETTKINGPLSSDNFTIVINVKNQNHAPTIANQSFEIPEKKNSKTDWPNGTLVPNGTVKATDPDGDNLTFKVETSGVPFDFKPGTSSLIVKDGSVLDFEDKATWTFKVSVTDPSGASASATITVNLTDVNEGPTLVKKETEYSIEENSAKGTAANGELVIFDNDKVSGSYETLTYTLSGSLAKAVNTTATNLNQIFEVVEVSNSKGTRTLEIRVKNQSLLDYEALYNGTNATYPVTITVTDGEKNKLPIDTKIAVIDVNEKPWIKDATYYIYENAGAGEQLCAVYETQPEGTPEYEIPDCKTYATVDAGDIDVYNSSFGVKSYDLSKGGTSANANDYKSFTVSANGAIRVATGASFDYSKKMNYVFTVTAIDGGNLSERAKITVVIKKVVEPPKKAYAKGTVYVKEHSVANTGVASFDRSELTTEDQAKFDAMFPAGTDLMYTIKSDLTAPFDKFFKISLTEGEIQVANDIDYESLYTGSVTTPGTETAVTIVVSSLEDSDGDKFEITKNIVIIDANEKPVIKSAGPFNVDETTAGGKSVGTIEAEDPDFCSVKKPCARNPNGFNRLHYIVDEVKEVNGSTDFPFELNESTGEITLKAGEKLSYLKQQKYVFVVKVTDSSVKGSNPAKPNEADPIFTVKEEVTIYVTDVNEEPTIKVLSDLYEVKENTKIGTEFGDKIVVYDEDDDDRTEDIDDCKLSISVKDKNGTCKKGSCAQDLFKVVCVENTNSNFETPFKFVVKSDLDYEALYDNTIGDAIFDVTLSVTDTKGNVVSKDTKIQVLDVNEEPSFTEKKYEFTVRENITLDSVLGKAEASDPDIYNPNFGTLYYSLDGDADQIENFYIDEATGEIHVINNPKLDYETTETYQFNAVVTDKKTTKKVPVTITVKNESEPPIFPPDTPTKLYVDENTLEGEKLQALDNLGNLYVAAITAKDDDCKNGNDCKNPTYSLVAADGAPNDYKAFSINATTGIIMVAKDSILNYEVQKKYVIRVVATDGTNSKLKDSIDVTVNVNDVNDAPVFDKVEYEFEVAENQPAGEAVGAVFASDEDSWSELKFEISDYTSGSKDSESFKINESGRIFTTKKLNYEDKKVYQVWVTATDNGSSKGFKDYSTKTLVTINVIDKPDDPIIHDDGKAGYGVYEVTEENGIKNGSIVKDSKDGKDVCYAVEDEDAKQTEKLLAYVTDEGKTDADRLFDAIVEKSGTGYRLCLTVKNATALNYETLTHEHHIKIAVMDADKRTASVDKKITLVDVNEMPLIMGNLGFTFYDHKGKDWVVGKLYPEDVDTSAVFTDDVYAPIGGDTALFTITEDGKIKTKRDFDFQKESKTSFELKVSLSDRDSDKYSKLTTSATVTITLKNTPKEPKITSKEFTVDENSEGGTVVGQIDAEDPDGSGTLLFTLEEESPYVDVSIDGKITVLDGAVIDYEKMPEFTITVSVKDEDGMRSEEDIVIKVNDLNEKPTIKEQTIEFPEDTPPGVKKGPLEADDPDTKKEFNVLEFYPLEESSVFDITKDGEVVLKDKLDYESDTSYTLTVRVVDPKGLADTAAITIKVGNVVEVGEVTITRAEVRDSVYLDPDTLFVNTDVILVEWKQNGVTKSSLDSLHEGKNIIIKSYKDSTQDVPGADTLVVFYSTAAPIVEVDATKTKVEADNIYTIVEEVDKKDSSIYVNKKTKEVTVTVKDTVSDYEEKFNVEVVLDTIAVSNKIVQTMVDVSRSKPSLDDKPKDGSVSETPINGEKTKVSFKETVNGTKVTISYDVDDKGDIIKLPVINEDGETVMTEVIEVSTVVEVSGKDVVVSYKADAKTGKILYGDSEGNLVADAPKSSTATDTKSEDVKLKTGVGAFTVTYDFKGVEGNKATVSYVIDEKGKVVANEEGDRGYLVTYTYKNKYGNSADKSVFMVLDKLAPIVKILSPNDGQVVFANFVDVDWCIAVDGDEDNCVKQDTLNFQSLEKGVNTIKRIYRDKAGNETVAEVNVMMKKAKDVNIDLEKPMVIVSKDSVDKYYALNPPEKDQAYSVSIYNPTTQKESEVIVGNSEKAKKGSGEEPYPGYDGHIGPTLKIDLKLPIVSAVGGLATLDDIIINGHEVALEGVDAENSDKMEVADYVEKYCSDEFKENLGKDFSKATLYSSSARVTLWFYTTGGQFVDKYQFDYDLDDPEYVDKAGLVKFFFEMKPDINGELRDAHGRLYGTGPFIVKTKVEIRSKLRCTVPPVDGKAKFGDVIKSSDELLTRFGYRRPVLRGNEKKSSSGSKKSSSEKSSKKSSKK